MRVVGIDPGLRGALAAVDLDLSGPAPRLTVHEIADMPITDGIDGRPTPDPRGVARLLRTWAPEIIVLEHVEPRPTDGIVTAWRFASGFGSLLAACLLITEEPRTHLVRPKIWKGALGLDSDKSKSLSLARELFPEAAEQLRRVKDDGRAEALLLTHYHAAVLVPEPEMEVI